MSDSGSGCSCLNSGIEAVQRLRVNLSLHWVQRTTLPISLCAKRSLYSEEPQSGHLTKTSKAHVVEAFGGKLVVSVMSSHLDLNVATSSRRPEVVHHPFEVPRICGCFQSCNGPLDIGGRDPTVVERDFFKTSDLYPLANFDRADEVAGFE